MDEDKKSAELQELNKKLYQEEQEEQAALKQQEAEDSFYQKLVDCFDVNVLIVGDSIGEGTGTQTNGQQWFKQLQTYLRTVNKSKVSVTNISMGGNASYAGYVRTMALNDNVDYDLAIICYGQNDGTDGFSTNYESIIRAIKSKYQDCSIISILESSQRTYTEKMTTIQSICEHYSIPVADTIAAFNNSGKAYDDLTGDGVHPNDAGQEIYFETVKAVIDDNVAASTGKMTDTDVINADVHEFDNFIWYDASSDFERVDDTTFNISTKPIYRITEKHNWNLLLATLRAHGESGGEYSTFGALEKYDCRDWVSWARKRFGTESLIFLMGISMGGAIAMLSSNLEGIDCRKAYSHATSDNLWSLQWCHFYAPSLPAVYEKYKERGGRPVFHPADIKPFTTLLT